MTNVRPPVTSLQEHLGEIIEAVKRLPESAKGEFLERLIEVNFNDAGDRQIETDAKAGRLDQFIDEAILEHRDGYSRAP